MTKTLRSACVGLGVGAVHARTLRDHPRCELKAILEHDDDRARSFLDETPGAVRAAAFGDLARDPGIDLVAIASYDDDHFSQAREALAGGKHVFVEKPLCRNRAELEELKATWNSAGRPHLLCNLVLRAAPLFSWLKDRISEGRMGEIYAFDGDYLYGRIEKITAGWRGRIQDYSVMQGGGIHMVDLMLWLTGEEPSYVTAVSNQVCTKGSEFRNPDFVAATYEFPSGLVGRITANFGCVHPHQHAIRIFGTEATFLLDDQGARWHTGRDDKPKIEPITLASRPGSKSALIPGLVEEILARRPSDPSAEREFRSMSACLSADESLRQSDRVGVGAS